MTGFRVSAKGQWGLDGAVEGWTPDLMTFGKVMGGGFPAAAFGGRADVMSRLAPEGPVYQAGTLSGNPIATTAGLVTLRLATDAVYDHLTAAGETIKAAASEALTEAGVPHVVQSTGTMFSVFFTDDGPVRDFADASRTDTAAYAAFFHAMLDRGVYLPPSAYEAWFLSRSEEHTSELQSPSLPHALPISRRRRRSRRPASRTWSSRPAPCSRCSSPTTVRSATSRTPRGRTPRRTPRSSTPCWTAASTCRRRRTRRGSCPDRKSTRLNSSRLPYPTLFRSRGVGGAHGGRRPARGPVDRHHVLGVLHRRRSGPRLRGRLADGHRGVRRVLPRHAGPRRLPAAVGVRGVVPVQIGRASCREGDWSSDVCSSDLAASEALTEAGVPHVVQSTGTMFSVFFTDDGPVRDFADASRTDTAAYAAFFHAMLDRGVYLPPSAYEAWFLSSAHDNRAVQTVLDALPDAARAAAAASKGDR